VLSFLVLKVFSRGAPKRCIKDELTEKDIRQIHCKPGGEACRSCQIDEPAMEAVRPITRGKEKGHYYLKTVSPPFVTFMKAKKEKAL
jgi:hypothetical protein